MRRVRKRYPIEEPSEHPSKIHWFKKIEKVTSSMSLTKAEG